MKKKYNKSFAAVLGASALLGSFALAPLAGYAQANDVVIGVQDPDCVDNAPGGVTPPATAPGGVTPPDNGTDDTTTPTQPADPGTPANPTDPGNTDPATPPVTTDPGTGEQPTEPAPTDPATPNPGDTTTVPTVPDTIPNDPNPTPNDDEPIYFPEEDSNFYPVGAYSAIKDGVCDDKPAAPSTVKKGSAVPSVKPAGKLVESNKLPDTGLASEMFVLLGATFASGVLMVSAAKRKTSK